jgi:hypothetical protein
MQKYTILAALMNKTNLIEEMVEEIFTIIVHKTPKIDQYHGVFLYDGGSSDGGLRPGFGHILLQLADAPVDDPDFTYYLHIRVDESVGLIVKN